MKTPFSIYGDFECMFEKISTCNNNPEKSPSTKMSKYTPSGFPLFTHCAFDTTKNKLDYHSGKDCMKGFCKILKEHAERIMHPKKKK